jgi:hypothetical protein
MDSVTFSPASRTRSTSPAVGGLADAATPVCLVAFAVALVAFCSTNPYPAQCRRSSYSPHSSAGIAWALLGPPARGFIVAVEQH